MEAHEHVFKQRIAIPVIPKSFRVQSDIDLMRSRGKLQQFNFQQERYILARRCEKESCDKIQAYDLVHTLPNTNK